MSSLGGCDIRTWGRIYTTDPVLGQVPGPWQVVETDSSGFNDRVMITTLAQVLKLQVGESPFYGDWGIPAEQAVIQQLFPDYYVALTQQRFSQFFLSLTVTREQSPTPTYDIRVITNQGVVIPPGSYPQ